MSQVIVVAAKRTPFGRFNGSLAKRNPVALATLAAEGMLRGLDRSKIDQVIIGNVLAAGHGMNVARQVAIELGLPLHVAAWTINMMCGSGLQAVNVGAQALRLGESKAVLVGGVESMSQAPFLLPRPLKNCPLNVEEARDSMFCDGLIDSFSQRHMAETVEDLVVEFGLPREVQDAYAERSQRLTADAYLKGVYHDELVPCEELLRDEHPRPEVTLPSLASLRTSFRSSGTVTAGNASGVNDGAATLLMAEKSYAIEQGWPMLAEWIDGAIVGCDPQRMALGPVFAVRRLLEKSGRKLADIDHLEINEAFAGQVLACCREMEIDVQTMKDGRLTLMHGQNALRINPNGGAIAIGHPLAASGARLLTHLAWQIYRGKSKESIAALCVGGGMGIAALLKPMDS